MSKIKPENDLGNFATPASILDEVRNRISEAQAKEVYDAQGEIEKLNARIDKMALFMKESVAVKKKVSGFEFTDAQLDLISALCPNETTDNDFNAFVYLCKQYELDPLKKEVHFSLRGGKGVTQVTRDGLLKIANRDPQFDGIGGDVVYEGDILTKRDDESMHITYGPEHLAFNASKRKGAFANVYRKDRSKATTVFVAWSDYNTGKNCWTTHPNAMILKVAESMALKRAFSLSGLTSQEEVGE